MTIRDYIIIIFTQRLIFLTITPSDIPTDVNMVAEPKSHQVGRSRQNVNKTGNDW